jgi:hypothetical protein
MPQHVGVDFESQLGLGARPLNHPGKASRGNQLATAGAGFQGLRLFGG